MEPLRYVGRRAGIGSSRARKILARGERWRGGRALLRASLTSKIDSSRGPFGEARGAGPAILPRFFADVTRERRRACHARLAERPRLDRPVRRRRFGYAVACDSDCPPAAPAPRGSERRRAMRVSCGAAPLTGVSSGTAGVAQPEGAWPGLAC